MRHSTPEIQSILSLADGYTAWLGLKPLDHEYGRAHDAIFFALWNGTR